MWESRRKFLAVFFICEEQSFRHPPAGDGSDHEWEGVFFADVHFGGGRKFLGVVFFISEGTFSKNVAFFRMGAF